MGQRLRATATFEVTGWDETVTDEPADAPKLSRAIVTKTFHGDLEATSRADLLMCQSAGGSAGFVGQERVEGRIGERAGSFILQHGGLRWSGGQKTFGNVVPGSGTGQLRGLRGEIEFRHDASGAVLTLDYEFE